MTAEIVDIKNLKRQPVIKKRDQIHSGPQYESKLTEALKEENDNTGGSVRSASDNIILVAYEL